MQLISVSITVQASQATPQAPLGPLWGPESPPSLRALQKRDRAGVSSVLGVSLASGDLEQATVSQVSDTFPRLQLHPISGTPRPCPDRKVALNFQDTGRAGASTRFQTPSRAVQSTKYR